MLQKIYDPDIYYKQKLLHLRIVDPITNCWNFIRSLSDGYGCIGYHGKLAKVHRLIAYLYNINKDIDGDVIIEKFDLYSSWQVLHHCDNRKCFNPEHLFIGTNEDNVRDKNNKGRGNYPKGKRNWKFKITKEIIKEITDLYCAKIYKKKELAKLYGLCPGSISKMKLGNWGTHKNAFKVI